MHSTRSAPVLLGLGITLTVLAAAACDAPAAKSETKRQERAAACAKEGDRCEFAAGKLGLCTAREGSTALTCVSLH